MFKVILLKVISFIEDNIQQYRHVLQGDIVTTVVAMVTTCIVIYQS